ncbi:MAG: hypothetical protein ABSC06_23365 [Rhodopila sp.]
MGTVGYALTAHTAQSLTRSDTIFAATDGTAGVDGEKAYVAMSRHQGVAHLVVSDAAERKAIVRKQMIGAGQAPNRADVMQTITDNLSRFAEPQRATDVLRRSSKIERGRVNEPEQPYQHAHETPSLYQRMGLAPVVTRVTDAIREVAHKTHLKEFWAKAQELGRQARAREREAAFASYWDSPRQARDRHARHAKGRGTSRATATASKCEAGTLSRT